MSKLFKDLTLMDLITDAEGLMDDKTYFLFVDNNTHKHIALCRVVSLNKYYDFGDYDEINILNIHWGNHRMGDEILSIPELYVDFSSK